MKLILDFERRSEELLRNKTELERNRKEFSTIKAQFISLETRIKEFNQTTFDPNELIQLKDKLKLLYQTQEKIKHIENSSQKIPALTQEKESKLVEISTLQTELKDIKQQGIDLNFDKNDFIKVKGNYDSSFNEMRILEKEYSSISSSLYSAKKDLDVFNQTIEKNKENLVLLNSRKAEFKILLYLEEVYKNYKIERLSKLAPTISTIMKNLLIQLTDGKYDLVELDEHFNVFVYRNNIRQPLHLFSGGEKKLISLVQRLAISHIIVSKTSKKKFEYLGLDEVLGSMDEERQESILEGLRRLNDIFKQIVIVSHNSNLNELFDYTLRISQNADLSSSLSWDEDWDEEQIMNKII
jgi:DNA repair exonuclease SbcCD ATPase subunit